MNRVGWFWSLYLVAVCYAISGLLSHAFGATITLSSFPPNPGVLPGGGWQFSPGTTFGNPTGPRAWVNGVYGGVPKGIATDGIAIAGRAGTLGVSAASAVTLTEAAAAVGRCVIGANAVCAVGSAAYMAYKAYRALPPGDVPGSVVSGPGNFDYDPGMAPSGGGSGTLYCFNSSPGGGGCATSAPGSGQFDARPTYTSRGAAASAYVAWKNANAVPVSVNAGCGFVNKTYTYSVQTPPTETATVGAPSAWYFREDWSYPALGACSGGTGGSNTQVGTGAAVGTLPSTCPLSIDALNPAYNVPAGSPVGIDGKCPTARYNHQPMTVEQMKTIIAAGNAWTSDLFNGTKAAIDQGGQTVPADLTTTGPASQTGTPTTTTETTGTTTTTTTKTPTYNYTYNNTNNSITYTTTVVTTVNNGTTTTTTTTTDAPATPQDPQDPCTANPGRVGCSELGTPSDDKPVWVEKPVVYAAEDLGFGGSCPAPFEFDLSGGRHFVASYQAACDAAPIVRLGVLLLSTFGALVFIVGQVTRA